MDGGQPEIQSGDKIPLEDRVLRHGLDEWKNFEDGKYIPTFKFFDLSTDDIKSGYNLSVDWDQKTNPEEIIIRIGCTFHPKKNGQFKNYGNRVIYALEVNFLNNIEKVLNVIYDPISNIVEERGKPNNPSHTLVSFDFTDEEQYKQDRPAILTELRYHAMDKKVHFDIDIVHAAVNKYRQ